METEVKAGVEVEAASVGGGAVSSCPGQGHTGAACLPGGGGERGRTAGLHQLSESLRRHCQCIAHIACSTIGRDGRVLLTIAMQRARWVPTALLGTKCQEVSVFTRTHRN